MRIRVLGAYGGSTPDHRQTSFLLNGSVALDAGALTEALALDEQARVKAVLVTHSHMDHVASLPFLVENVFGRAPGAIEIYAPEDVVGSLKRHLFNDDLWPDFSRIPSHLLPTVTFQTVPVNAPFAVDGLTARAVPVSHVVPTYGYVVSDGTSSVVFSGDTGPTEALWKAAREDGKVKAIFVECSFPDGMTDIAEVSKHLTPASLRREMDKFPPSVPVHLYHMKPPTLAALASEVAALSCPRISLLKDGDVLTY